MKKMKIDKTAIITVSASLLCFIIFTLLLNGISTGYFVEMQNSLTSMMLVQTAGMSPGEALATLIGSFTSVIAALVFLTLGFSILASYGAFAGERKTGTIAGAVSGTIMLVAFHFSLIAFLLFIAMIILCTYIVPLSNTYFQELGRWKFFRTGSHSVSKALLVFNTLLAVGIFLSVSSNLDAYSESFTAGFSSSISKAVMSEEMIEKSVEENYPGIPEEQKQQVIRAMKEQASATVDKTIAQSPVFRAYVTWLPLVVAGTVWITIEFLRSMIYSNIAGMFSSLLIRIYGKLSS